MDLNGILLADLDDWIRIAVIVIFVLGPLIGQIGKNRQRKGPVQQPGQGKPGGAPPAQRPKGLAAEIERILREAEKAARDAVGKVEEEVHPDRPRADLAAESSPVASPKRLPESPQRRKGPMSSSVSHHVQEHIQSRPVSERSQDLGKRIKQAKERVEKRLHDAFDHQVGGLDSANVGTLRDGSVSSADSGQWQQLADARAEAAKVARAGRN